MPELNQITVLRETVVPSITSDPQTANTVYAGPSSGASANPAFRALVMADVPKVIQLACSDETTALTAGTGKITFRDAARYDGYSGEGFAYYSTGGRKYIYGGY